MALRPGTLPAVFMRGGTSKALMLHRRDVPGDLSVWEPVFLSAMDSPDPFGRQLNGMGGGVSSVSKICVVARSERPDADIDYTFVQVVVREGRIDLSGNCGNMLSAVGPFAVDEGLVEASDGPVRLRIFNTNTRKLIEAHFAVDDGRTLYRGDLAIPGVAGTGAPIRLDFIDPGGATTGRLLPTGAVRQSLDVPGLGPIEASLVDAANACVFVRAADLGLTGVELPAALEAIPGLLDRLGRIRRAASVAMGIAPDLDAAVRIVHVPFVGIVAPPLEAGSLSGAAVRADDIDLTARVISNGVPHQALPLTATLCLAVAARIEGSLVHEAARPTDVALRVGMPSGILTADAAVTRGPDGWRAERGAFFRTTRPLMRGAVYVDAAPLSA
ncbi:2-methylaconitate cis-trans isomerase PrpF family protein [Methylobacterium sp. E-005]|uniref:2-methylaconitate cis-trans isomerase PrpF family protein n=1 Tax=Methylobacterium sp. E-005 TaxID=2836549 RepID=UPI001FBB4C5B|nr:2-methylaconitate cis-trans isomerase PrpF family protein [Methylobacterium sp. E-005]MCJ2090860.1 2-methylaconitate cis-trans isomerase PrpF family protein [Methylobacterium sp. E-005]